jgi:thiamine pyrophosphate-dependent acetolactate synthase large subunit-like protein
MLGVETVYRDPDPAVATLLARASARVHGRPAGVDLGDGVVSVSLAGEPPGLPAADEADPWPAVDPGVLAALRAAERPVVLAGPGVVHSGCVAGLAAMAAAASVGVLNTWGAKGVFDWRSRHHWATVGLQARDFELGGLADADLIVAVGVDEAETPVPWRLAPVVSLAPRQLAPTSEAWWRPRGDLVMPPLRDRLAAVTQAGWAFDGAPLAPTQATLNYGRCFGAGGLVAAEPGTAGFWVARTFTTTTVGSVHVPAVAADAGLAVACAVVARLARPGRPVLVVSDGPLSDVALRVLEAGRARGATVACEVWEPDGPALSAAEHLARLERLGPGETVALATDPGQMGEIVEAAGPVVAWGR